MKLGQATVYGFGKWVDFTIDFSEQSFICVYGENESGKSTLQQFILFMLFGLPPKMRAFYRPKTSSRMGGRLTVSDPEFGEFTIERLDNVRNGAAKCFGPDGSEFDEDWLKERLNGMTHDTYQSIFSFSAMDLYGLRNMSEEDLGEVLLGIGLTGSKSIYAIEKRLENKASELFKPNGRKPAINKQLESLDELFIRLHKYKNSEATYREKKAAAQALTDDIALLRSRSTQESKRRSIVEKQQHVLPIIHQYHNCTNNLQNYPACISFPENGIDRLQAIKDKLLPLKSELTVLEDNKQKYETKLDEITKSLHDESVYKQLEEMLKQKDLFLENKNNIKKLQQSIYKVETEIKMELDQLNMGIEPKDLETISLPFYIEKTWNQLKHDADQLSVVKEQLQQEESTIKKQRFYLSNQKQEKQDLLLPEKQVNELNERINTYNRQRYLQQVNQKKAEQQGVWEELKREKTKRSSQVLIGSVVLASLLGISGMVMDSFILYVMMSLFLIVGSSQWVWRNYSIRLMERIMHEQENDMPINQPSIDEKDIAEELLAEHKKHNSDLQSVEEQLKALNTQLIQWEERKKLIENRESRFNQQVEDQYANYSFLKNVRIMYWPEFYHTIKHVMKLMEQKRSDQEEYRKLIERQERYNYNIHRFFEERAWRASTEAMEENVVFMEEQLENYRNQRNLAKQYTDLVKENKNEQYMMTQRMRTYEREVEALYTSAHVETEDDFFKKAKQWKEMQLIVQNQQQLFSQLRAIFSKDESEELLKKDMNESNLKEEHIHIKEKEVEIENNIEKKRQELAYVNTELSNMESSETYSELMHRFGMEQEQLQKLANEWAVFRTAKEMLLETKRNYRDKYLSKVISKTSSYFGELTDGQYEYVFAPTEEMPFQVEAKDGVRYIVNELSQGTIDQLYVSLRLAISEVMIEEHRLPFIIDDAFVHFDAVRTKQVMKIMDRFSHDQQILLFTCKREVLEWTKQTKTINLANSVRIS
ncbi:AAA family ATPase [Virgibacillus byunsanensis]|uniref:AAA family ATPase n=1 Tax=Virgibacillus byunsanensis TaxID=570945 RepID=A0ABW3LH25_9BACI